MYECAREILNRTFYSLFYLFLNSGKKAKCICIPRHINSSWQSDLAHSSVTNRYIMVCMNSVYHILNITLSNAGMFSNLLIGNDKKQHIFRIRRKDYAMQIKRKWNRSVHWSKCKFLNNFESQVNNITTLLVFILKCQLLLSFTSLFIYFSERKDYLVYCKDQHTEH